MNSTSEPSTPQPGKHGQHADGTRNPWQARADELAAWTLARLVNRVDVWGGYGGSGPLTLPAKRMRGAIRLIKRDLVGHFEANDFRQVVGLHSGSAGPNSTAKWIAADIDQHGEDNDETCHRNAIAAIHWFERARRLGFRPLLTDSNGKGGYHLRILFAEPIALDLVYRFGRFIFADAPQQGLPRLEIFPKQSQLAATGECGQYGNWMRAPGRHYKRDHWSEVWNGSAWLKGAEAIDYILATNGDDPNLLPAELRNKPPTPKRPVQPVIVIPGMTTAYAAAAFRNECRRVASAPESTRNTTLNKAAFALGRFVGSGELDRHRVETALTEAATCAGLTNSEIKATIHSGIEAGMAQPRGRSR